MDKLTEEMLDSAKEHLKSLNQRLQELSDYIGSDRFELLPRHHQAMLKAQLDIMREYRYMLNARITDLESEYNGGIYASFSVALSLLKNGFAVTRDGWGNRDLIVFKQIPADIAECIVPNMTSLPMEAKRHILKGAKHINYQSQCLIYNKATGRADSWTPTIRDIFANDWELVIS